jgi:hypothetical protein
MPNILFRSPIKKETLPGGYNVHNNTKECNELKADIIYFKSNANSTAKGSGHKQSLTNLPLVAFHCFLGRDNTVTSL